MNLKQDFINTKSKINCLLLVLIFLIVVGGCCLSESKKKQINSNNQIENNSNKNVENTDQNNRKKNLLETASNSKELLTAVKNYRKIGDFQQKNVKEKDIKEINDEFLKNFGKSYETTAAIEAVYTKGNKDLELSIRKFPTEQKAADFFSLSRKNTLEAIELLLRQTAKNVNVTKKEENGATVTTITGTENGIKKETVFTSKQENGVEVIIIEEMNSNTILKRKNNVFFLLLGTQRNEGESQKYLVSESQIIDAFLKDL